MKHVPHSTFATSIQKIHTMKADISITKSRKGTEIVVSGKRINKYGIIAAIVFAVPMLILFQSIHGETTSHLSLVRFSMCILAAVLVNLFLHKLLFRLFFADTHVAISHHMPAALPATGYIAPYIWYDKWQL